MSIAIYSRITGTGSYIPTIRVLNEDFLSHEFYDTEGVRLKSSNQEIIDKFLEITTISERRYVTDDITTSDIAYFAGIDAIQSASIDKEHLDYIIVAHNFGDVRNNVKMLDIVPSIAARVKNKLDNHKIINGDTIVFASVGAGMNINALIYKMKK